MVVVISSYSRNLLVPDFKRDFVTLLFVVEVVDVDLTTLLDLRSSLGIRGAAYVAPIGLGLRHEISDGRRYIIKICLEVVVSILFLEELFH